jgi:hypothetical protein
MTDPNIRRASLADIRKMKEAKEVRHDADAPEGVNLGTEFWADAEIKPTPKRTADRAAEAFSSSASPHRPG